MDTEHFVLITGCSSGIGLSLAVHLASNQSKAYKVYATMWNLDKKQGGLRQLEERFKKKKTCRLPFNEVCFASKLAVEGACESLAILLQHFNIQTEASDEALEVDAHTRSLYDQYLQHCQAVYQNAAQDTEDITQVLPPAIEAQTPFLRYNTNRAQLPMSSLKLTSMDGAQYIRAMSKLIFSAPNTDPQI
uniref:Uncharacterized protein n=1 Tax=Cyprinus carpio TaxID=7962 RepID=A0A8C2GA10_CYPCA